MFNIVCFPLTVGEDEPQINSKLTLHNTSGEVDSWYLFAWPFQNKRFYEWL